MDEYNFNWSHIGNIEEGRPNLGKETRVEIYRLMQYTLRAVLENEYGENNTRMLLKKAGRLAGVEFCKNRMDYKLPLNKFIAQLHDLMLNLGVGIFKVEKFDSDKLSFVVTVSEDLDCSGLPVNDTTVCDYDEGFLEGVFYQYSGKEFIVKEIDCWSTGERTCRFTIDLAKMD